ncbi:MAG TPA: penicillin-binding protein 2, partial [Devosiaceae bacterium]|nr:penicillin-binding protein 2 [Devosiaceae bacterium]
MALSRTTADPIAIVGAQKARGNLTRNRIRLAMVLGCMIFAVVAGRLVQLALSTFEDPITGQVQSALRNSRPALLDRNGIEMAIDIQAPSLFAEPRNIVDLDEAVEKLARALPELDRGFLRERLDGDEGFVWIARELTPAQQERIFRLGIPGVDFLSETKRYYPGGPVAAHVLGAVNIDNVGIAGVERHIDREEVALLQELGFARDAALQPERLSIDLRVQNAMHRELTDALTRYQAIAAAGVMMNVNTGEIVALVSLPDFDPNHPATALEPVDGRKDARINRITAGTFELGSTFKTITMAAALDAGAVSITDRFDATRAIRFGRYAIDDFHGEHRVLSVPEIYRYSSNIGIIKVMQAMGKDNYRAFLTRLGLDAGPIIELPERKTASVPETFSEVGAATAAFGHGLSVTPLQLATAYAALVNGGTFIPPTLFMRSEAAARAVGGPVVARATSDQIRYLMRLNGREGTGSRTSRIADGFRVGGKTGTAEKVIDGRYSSEVTLAVFASAFPMDDPQYAMVILVDEPQRENAQSGKTAAWNAGDVSGRIIRRVGPMLGVMPDFDPALDSGLV